MTKTNSKTLAAQAAQVQASQAAAAQRLHDLAVDALDGKDYDQMVATAALVEAAVFDQQAIELARRIEQARAAERQAERAAQQRQVDDIESRIRQIGAEREELTRRMRADYPNGEPHDPAGIVRFATDRARVLELSQAIEQLQREQQAVAFSMAAKGPTS